VKTARLIPFVALAASAGSLIGCAAPPATMTVSSQQKHVSYAQTFQQAYAGRTDDGTYEFLLVADDAQRATAAQKKKPGQPLEPIARPPLRQVVYLKVLWRPMTGTDSSAANNATIDWYVLSDAASGQTDLLEYQGTAFVYVTPKDNTAKVDVRAGTITPFAARGSLHDPVGVAHLSGSFTAVANDDRLEELLAATRARTTGEATTASSR